MIQRTFRYRLAPTAEQEEWLWQVAGVTRFVYNLALEQRRDFWRQARSHGVIFNFATQGRQVTELRREVDWIGGVPCVPLTQALRDLDRAMADFFAGRSRFPKHRRKGVNDSFRFQGKNITVCRKGGRWATVRLPKIGLIKYRDTRPIRGEIVNATIAHDALGWHVCFAVKIEHDATPSALPAVGIDRGVANTLALSTGELLSTPGTGHLERRRAQAQRILARRQRGSNRYRKQRRRAARIAARIARVRADWQHRTGTQIARRFGSVALEDLDVIAMTASGPNKRGLNRNIRAQGWSAFERKLTYKLEERGGTLTKVNPAYTSQTCSDCGVVDKASRKSQSSFACRHCGFTANADINAAINILRRSTAGVEGAGCGPDEARTGHALAA